MSLSLFNSVEDVNPRLSPIAEVSVKRLVDDGLLHYEASLGGFAERYRRGETPHTIHVWWARRPHSAMRALVYACLCKKRSYEQLSLMRELSSSAVPSVFVLDRARDSLLADYNYVPRILDMFSGSGTIPFEAALLGAESYSVDSNEMAVFIQKNLMEISKSCSVLELRQLVHSVGKRLLNTLAMETEPLFPLRRFAYSYLWTYSHRCAKCHYEYMLSKRFWLSKKNGRRLAIIVQRVEPEETVKIADVDETFEPQTVWQGKNGNIACPKCGHVVNRVSIKECRDRLIAYVGPNGKSGKRFCGDVEDALPDLSLLAAVERDALKMLGATLPTSPLPRWSGVVNPALYGMDTHADIMNLRQRTVLLLLMKCLAFEHRVVASEHGCAIANAVIGMLSGLVNHLIDWNCRLSMWIPQNEQVGRAFCGPGVPMLWDYAETDPLQHGPSNLWDKLDRIIAGIDLIGLLKGTVNIQRGYAQELPFQDSYFDAIVTDPPYYDNIHYSVLADFFFSWKRILLANLWPDIFTAPITDSSRELVASSFRSGNPVTAHRNYCIELGKAIREAERVLRDDGVFALLYSHKSLQGWESLVRAYRPTGFEITSVQPLSIERKARPRAIGSDAVNTCVVFVAHKRSRNKPIRSLSEMEAELRERCTRLKHDLGKAGWQAEDIAVSAYAQGVGMLANVQNLTDCPSDLYALKRFEYVIKEHYPRFRVTTRRSL